MPGIYLAVRWYFVPQTVVIEGARGTPPCRARASSSRASGGGPSGSSLLANIAIAIPGFILLAPFTAIAESTDRAVWALVGLRRDDLGHNALRGAYSTLLYYDLLARRVV